MKKYKTIVIDPPWNVGLTGGKLKDNKYYRCGKPMPYKLMTDKEIENFPINDFADNNCDLFMWVTHSKLPSGLKIMENWGFKYHCLITWDKTNGIGLHGFHRKSEMVLYGYHGRMGIDKGKGKYIPTLFTEKLTINSAKPQKFYTLIRLGTQEPRIDIFARKSRAGFDVWGNEAPNFTQLSLPSADGDIIIAKSNKIKDFTSDEPPSESLRTFADAKGI